MLSSFSCRQVSKVQFLLTSKEENVEPIKESVKSSHVLTAVLKSSSKVCISLLTILTIIVTYIYIHRHFNITKNTTLKFVKLTQVYSRYPCEKPLIGRVFVRTG